MEFGIAAVNRTGKAGVACIGGVNRDLKEGWGGVGGVNRKIFASYPAGALYWLGSLCADVTGGWDRRSFVGVAPTYAFNSDYANIYGVGNPEAGCNGFIVTTNPIDLTNYTTLHVLVTTTAASNGNFTVRIGSNAELASSYAVNWEAAKGVLYTDYEGTLDISSLNSAYYIGMGVAGGINNNVNAKFYRVWLT